ncbi:MAG: hypothetical protein V4515_12370 [Chloroflexota bacterium]
MPKPSAATFDPRSDRVVLHYLGSDEGVPSLVGIPARDLTEADIARLVYARALNDYDGSDPGALPDPADPDQGACRALVALLVERALYTTDVVPAPEPAPTEDVPALEPVEG